MMQSRRQGLTPLAIVLPHPPLPRRRSSLLSLNSATSPHTPRSSGCYSQCPQIYYPVAANRKSTDSWNSSNAADEMEFDWKPEQVLLLSRTLDALPAHLVTPFNGPVPPSNLLDKIARGVSQAKGAADWPHSIRATRGKLLELARSRAKEDTAAEHRRQVIKEEVEIDDGSASSYSYFHDGEEKVLGGGPRRPLYRQSSMDFIKPGPAEIKENTAIARLSNRLQRSDRLFPNPAYHPYSRTPRNAAQTTTNTTHRRSSSPPLPTDVPSLINPSTPSSSTLNSFSSLNSAAAPRILRRSASTFSSSNSMFSTSSGSGLGVLSDPRIQRVRRSDSFGSGLPPPKSPMTPVSAGMKRAPSYGALAQEVRLERAAAAAVQGHARKLSGSYPSSDEEEKARTKRAKKLRTKVPSTPSAPSPPSSSVPSSPGESVITTAPSSPVVMKSRVKSPQPPLKEKEKSKPHLKGVVVEAPKSPTPKSPTPKSKNSSKPSTSNMGKDKAEEAKTGKSWTKDGSSSSTAAVAAVSAAPTRHRPAPMNLQRNPSMFGAELPHLHESNMSSNNNNHNKAKDTRLTSPTSSFRSPPPTQLLRSPTINVRSPPPASVYTRTPAPASAAAHAEPRGRALSAVLPNQGINMNMSAAPHSPMPMSPTSPTSPMSPSSPPMSPKVKTLRRVRRLAPARRISFGSLVASAAGAAGDEADMEDDGAVTPAPAMAARGCLGSAFQLL